MRPYPGLDKGHWSDFEVAQDVRILRIWKGSIAEPFLLEVNAKPDGLNDGHTPQLLVAIPAYNIVEIDKSKMNEVVLFLRELRDMFFCLHFRGHSFNQAYKGGDESAD